MFAKKISLFMTSLGLLSLTPMAYADLITVNNTDHYAVGIVANTNTCTGIYKDLGITKPHSTIITKKGLVKQLCDSKLPCTATMIMSVSYNDAVNCKGDAIAVFSINDFETDSVEIIQTYPSDYEVTANNNTVTISK